MKPKINILTVALAIGAFIWTIVTIGGFYKVTQSHALTNSEIDEVIMRDTMPAEVLKPVKGKPIKGVNVNEIVVPNEFVIADGKDLFTNMCASCHGAEGKGDGAGGATLNPKPRNFTDTVGWKNGTKISALYKTIEEGIPGSGMTAYEFLAVKDKFALIHYIRTFGSHFQNDTPEELAAFNDAYELDSDRRGPSQIPMDEAIAKTIAEREALILKTEEMLAKYNQDKTGKAALLADMVNDERGVFRIIAKDTNWRAGPTSFYNIASVNVGKMGFKDDINKLDTTQIKAIYEYLSAM